MEENIDEQIVSHYEIIKDIRQIKHRIKNNVDNTVKFRIETKALIMIGGFEPHATKVKHTMSIPTNTMLAILDAIKDSEKAEIDKLIDNLVEAEIEKRKKE